MDTDKTIDKPSVWIGRAILKAIKFTWNIIVMSILYFFVLAGTAWILGQILPIGKMRIALEGTEKDSVFASISMGIILLCLAAAIIGKILDMRIERLEKNLNILTVSHNELIEKHNMLVEINKKDH
jgi:hypothetical protein